MDIKTLGNNIRKRRKSWGYSQRDLAIRSDLSTQTIFQVEHGRTSAEIKTLNKISMGLGCELSDLFKEIKGLKHVRFREVE